MKRSTGSQHEAADAGASLVRGRRHYTERAWADARDALLTADAERALCAEDLERLAMAAGLIGKEEEQLKALERAHHAHLAAGDELRAARVAFWSGYRLLPLGEPGRAQAWFARAQRIVDRARADCVERGYLLLPTAARLMSSGTSKDEGHALATRACEIGERFADCDLVALARVLIGRSMLLAGDVERGLAYLDEAMLGAASSELSPSVTGLIYCHVISACSKVYALDRAREWTAALSEWCEAQPQLGGFAGTCLVHRAELMELGGAWSDAIEAAHHAERCMSATSDPRAPADACYQRAEIHRLRGEFSSAEAAYAQASSGGREPLPGLALLRLAQGRCDLAASAMRRVLVTCSDRLQRARYLPAHADVMLAAGELDTAREARDELCAIAAAFDTPVLRAIADQTAAAVALAEGAPHTVVEPLRGALHLWQRVGAPYLAARVHVQLGRAFRELGDEDGAQLEWTAAREAFEALGAAPDLSALQTLAGRAGERSPPASAAHGLSARELQVLRMVAAGKTNRVIATELHLSEKTVDRHVSNIFGKLDVSSRAAATAFAYEHGLIARWVELPSARSPAKWGIAPKLRPHAGPIVPCIAHIARTEDTMNKPAYDVARAEQLVETGEAFARLDGIDDTRDGVRRAQAERFDVIVIGGGQAGLSLGYHLKQQGARFTILDAHERIGDAWRKRWDSLKLFTPAWLDSLDGLSFPGPRDAFPTKDEMADYLEAYATHFELPVRSSTRVDRLYRDGERFVARCGERELHANQVVIAMGGYQKKRVPEFAHELRAGIVQLHSSDYRNPAQLAPGAVLVVGCGNSGAEIAIELARTHAVHMVSRKNNEVPVSMNNKLFARVLMRLVFHHVLTMATPVGRKAARSLTHGTTPLIRTKARDLAEAGVERSEVRVTGMRDGLPLLEDGRALDVQNVIWCTGFQGAQSWIDLPIFDAQGDAQHQAGVVASQPGLYFVGLPFLYSMSSSMVHGVGRDAKRIAGLVSARGGQVASGG